MRFFPACIALTMMASFSAWVTRIVRVMSRFRFSFVVLTSFSFLHFSQTEAQRSGFCLELRSKRAARGMPTPVGRSEQSGLCNVASGCGLLPANPPPVAGKCGADSHALCLPQRRKPSFRAGQKVRLLTRIGLPALRADVASAAPVPTSHFYPAFRRSKPKPRQKTEKRPRRSTRSFPSKEPHKGEHTVSQGLMRLLPPGRPSGFRPSVGRAAAASSLPASAEGPE